MKQALKSENYNNCIGDYREVKEMTIHMNANVITSKVIYKVKTSETVNKP